MQNNQAKKNKKKRELVYKPYKKGIARSKMSAKKGLKLSAYYLLFMFLYLLLGAAGMPVFSGFQGGIGCLAGVTGGYLWGFAFSGLIYWLLERFGKLPAMIAAQLTCYLFGSFWFYLYAGGGLWLIIARCVLPFLLPDAIKIALACTLTRRLARHIT